MFKSKKILLSTVLTSLLLASTVTSAAEVSTFNHVSSTHNFTETTQALKESISSNGLMVMGNINQQKVMSMSGLKMEGAQSFLVGSPKMGKKVLEMAPAAGANIPLRIYVWEEQGKTTIGWFNPEVLMTSISPKLQKAGSMLESQLSKVVADAVK
ncbi:DUF302 domain-containing protein [Vibrio sp. SS-MA-C1-2]|uniref:DUF302 domain-containing protein n=1 Tax=Vibrio sp. SS-MA-C1-2 TaxID=2908646 RepID=UPI001F17EFCB|nr:DUF302 domain-containing protein [Vibrio sp. SS-MA-C1-2]UJF17069.1 DUF302 domain-containing protein [Vibrio sp. SS-MA-C1-2]